MTESFTLTIKNLAIAFALLSLPVLASCTPGPDHARPQTHADKTARFVNASEDLNTKNLKHFKEGMSHWWRHIKDPKIHSDIAVLLQQNLDLKEAEARINQARQQIKINAGMLAPMVTLDASRNRNFRPAEEFSNIFGGGGVPVSSGTTRVFDTSIEGSATASWQLDLFGRLRNEVAASEARFAAAEMDKEALLHSLIAELVRRRVSIASLGRQLELANSIAQNRQNLLDLLERRYELGSANITSSDVLAARRSFASVKSDIPDIEQAMREELYAIDVLLGQTPGTTLPRLNEVSLETPELDVPVGIPAYLLDRRPDLRSAELRLLAENKDIGVAISNLYPSFSISGNLGFEDETTNNLFVAERLIGSAIAQASATLFQGGALRARIRLEEAQKEELVARYTKDVLTAMREVETALMQERKISERLDLIETEIQSADARARTDRRRYEQGILTLSDYLESELDFYNAEINKTVALRAKWNARVNLYLALGGDWIKDMPIKTAIKKKKKKKEEGHAG